MKLNYYVIEVIKLLAIMEQDNQNPFVSRVYVREKLKRILSGVGIGIHSSLEDWVNEYYKKLVKTK